MNAHTTSRTATDRDLDRAGRVFAAGDVRVFAVVQAPLHVLQSPAVRRVLRLAQETHKVLAAQEASAILTGVTAPRREGELRIAG